MNNFISLKRAALGLLMVATGLTAWAGAVDFGWQANPVICNTANGRPAPQHQSSFHPLFVSGTPSGSTTYYNGPSPTAATPELQALATGLDNDPVKIFNYVHNHVDFQPYYGSVKGAQLTYLDGAGNDMDQASLLIALLNAAGYSQTQYVYGYCTFPDISSDKYNLANWLQTTQYMANLVMSNAGYPVYNITINGNSGSFQYPHTWVEVTINGTIYSLDPSYKQYPNNSIINLKTASGYNQAALLADAQTGETVNGTSHATQATNNYVQYLNRTKVESDLGTYAMNLRSNINAISPAPEMEQIIGGGHILQQPITNLNQGATPAVFSPQAQGRFSSIPAQYLDSLQNQTYALRATYEAKVDSDIDETFYTDSLQGTRVSLVFSALNAQLWWGDALVAQQNAGSSPTASVFTHITLPRVAPPSTHPASPYNRSGTYDLTYSLEPSTSSGVIDESTRQIQNYLAAGLPNTSRQLVTETLHSLGLQWARRVAFASSLVSRTQSAPNQPPDVAILIVSICGRTAQEAGYYVDMPQVDVLPLATDVYFSQNTTAASNAFNTAAFIMSSFEHGVLEQDPITNPATSAFSTTKCLSYDNDLGDQVFLINQGNYNSIIGYIPPQANPPSTCQLTNYSTGELTTLYNDVMVNNDTLLVHQNGQIGGDPAKGQWVGNGYAAINSSQVAMIIAGPWGSSSGGNSLDQRLVFAPAAINTAINYDFGVSSPDPAVPLVTGDSTGHVASAEPVDLVTGAYTMSHADLTLGEQGSPRGLNFTRYYDSSRNFTASPLGNGWRHSCQGNVTICSELGNAFGLTQPTDAVQTIVGFVAAGDLISSLSSTQPTPLQVMVGLLAEDWMVNRITNNAANIQLGNQTMTYISQPDGSWNPPPGSTTALTGASGSFTLQPRLGGSIAFDTQDRISQWKDVDGNTQNYAYSGSNLSTVTDTFGRMLTFNYNSSGAGTGLLGSVVDSTGRTVGFNYTTGTSTGVNSPSNLTGITDPENFQNTLAYDSRNRLIDWKDNNLAVITHNDYDVLDRVYQQFSQDPKYKKKWLFNYSPGMTLEIDPQGGEIAQLFDYKNRNIGTIDALGFASSIDYDGQNHAVLTVDATNRQMLAIYDSNQNLSSTTDNNNKSTLYQYETSFPFRLSRVTDATGRYTKYENYDAHNHLGLVTDPGGRQMQYFYRSDGLLDHVIDSANNTTSYTAYDSYGNCTNVTRADGTKTSATYNARGDLLTSTDGRQKTTTFTYYDRRLLKTRVNTLVNSSGTTTLTTKWQYDANGNPCLVTDRNGHTVTSFYDNLGHVQSVQSQDTAAVISGYDSRDWLASVTDGLGHATTYGYYANGWHATVTNALSIRTTLWNYDNAGRVSGQQDGLNHATQFFYDTAGRLDYSQDPLNYAIDYEYDDAGRKTTLANKLNYPFGFGYAADGLPSTFTYPSGRQSQIIDRDPHGLPKTLQSPSGHQTALTYDAMSRTKTSTDGVGAIVWTYDNEGHATDVTETIGTNKPNIHRDFDDLGRVTSCTDTQRNIVGYGYDNEGNLTTITYPGGNTVNYYYDGSNRLKTVTDWAGRLTTYYYDNAGRLQTVLRPNNTQQSVALDAASRLTASSEQLVNSNGAVVNTLWSALYGYDNDNHLTSFVPTPLEPTPAPSAATTTYNADNEVATFNGQNVSYDLDGNMQSAPVTVAGSTSLGALTWDARNRLTSAGGVTYTYDAENRRVSSTVNGQTTTYVWARGRSLDKLLAKQNPDGSVTRYVYGAAGLLYEVTSVGNVDQNPIYYHFDWRGDTVALSDASGNVIEQLSYSPYGQCTVTPVTGTVNTPFGFNGEWGVLTEPTGLLAMQARFYSPVIQRFLNEDPSGFAGGNNVYAFAAGDPVDLMDPFGLGPQNTSVFAEAGAAAIDGGNRYANTLTNDILYAPQNLVNAAGTLVGYAVSLIDPGTRGTILSDTAQDFKSLGSAKAWQATGNELISPEGLANTAFAVDLGLAGGLNGSTTAPSAAESAPSFFDGASYTDKVQIQMQGGPGEFHSFPELVKNYESAGTVTPITGGDGITRQMLEIPGSYSGRDGAFQFIKNADGTINHRMFLPSPPPGSP